MYFQYELFDKVDWDWFGDYNPADKNIQVDDLIGLIPLFDGDLCCYSIHENANCGMHIHFVLRTDQKKNMIMGRKEKRLTQYLESFNPEKSKTCFEYLTSNQLPRRGNQKLVEYGCLMGVNTGSRNRPHNVVLKLL